MQMRVLAEHWLPHASPDNPEVLGAALWLDRNHWKQMRMAVAAGIDTALTGSGDS